MKEEKPYKNKKWLYQKYWIEELSTNQIGVICEVCHRTIQYWMKKLGIKIRTISEANKGRTAWNKDKKWSKKMKRKFSEVHIGLQAGKNHPFYGKNHTEKTKKIIIKKNKQWWKNHPNPMLGKHLSQKTKKILSQRIKEIHQKTNIYSNPEYIKRKLKAIAKRPTIPEKIFDDMTPEIIRYVGNRAWWRYLPNGKNSNPDFKVTGQNKVIFVHGDYWHRNDNPQELINLYKQIGFKCLVIWENEIHKKPEMVKEKVNNFMEI